MADLGATLPVPSARKERESGVDENTGLVFSEIQNSGFFPSRPQHQ
jgi:hypothetical protein